MFLKRVRVETVHMKTQHEKQIFLNKLEEQSQSHLCGILLQTIQALCRSETGLQPRDLVCEWNTDHKN